MITDTVLCAGCNQPIVVKEWGAREAQVLCPHGCNGWTIVRMSIVRISDHFGKVGGTILPEVGGEKPPKDQGV